MVRRAVHVRRFPVGGYVLDALEQPERWRFQQHLAGCRRCRRDYEALRGLPAMLAQLPAPQAVALHARLQPQPRGGWPVRRAVPHWVTAAALAAALAGAGAELVREGRPTAPPAVVALVAAPGADLGPTTPAGSATLSRRAGGSRVQLRLRGVPVGSSCSLVVVRRDGTRQTLGGWTADYAGRARVAFDSATPPGGLRAVLVETGPGRLLLQGLLRG